jgi:SpoVK/Ycf46/Vps4 family AAA+-type ATPase
VLIQEQDLIAIKNATKAKWPDLPVDEELLDESLKALDALVGMDNIKKEIHELVRLVRFYKESGKDVLGRFYLHTVFVGNPGTGKTTVARILTRIYKALGMLEKGHIVETDRMGLVAGYVGQTAIKTSEKIDDAMGGVLFIDEAYALTSKGGAQGDFGDEAIQTLLKRMEDNRGKFFVFVAGYPENMENFLKANPGLHSRFDKILRFEDYSPDELFSIFQGMVGEFGFFLTEKAADKMKGFILGMYHGRDKYFGNARTMRQIAIEAMKNQNLRLSQLSPEARSIVQTNAIEESDLENLQVAGQNSIFKKPVIGFKKEK